MNGNIKSVKPPSGLFTRIIKRLGLEKQLYLVKRHLGFFVSLSAVFLFLSVFAFIGLKHVLKESSFGSFLSLIFSDPGMVMKYPGSFLFSVFESMPGVVIVALLLSVAFLMLFARFSSSAIQRLFVILKSIQKQKYEHRKNI